MSTLTKTQQIEKQLGELFTDIFKEYDPETSRQIINNGLRNMPIAYEGETLSCPKELEQLLDQAHDEGFNEGLKDLSDSLDTHLEHMAGDEDTIVEMVKTVHRVYEERVKDV